MTGAETDAESIKHLDFDLEIACGVRLEFYRMEEPCQRPARWMMRCRVCNVVAAACDEHMQMIRGRMTTDCARCNAAGPGNLLWEFLPLGRAS